MKIKHCIALLSGAFAGLLTANQAMAAQLEEITVTARKTSETLMDTPLSVSVIGSEMIDNANLQNIEQIATLTPNLKFNQAFGRQGDRPVIRGLSSIFTRQELAGYFVDGVWVSGSLATYDLSNIERVEVIKGPQSATFGRRTFSGAINYVTKGPSEDLTGNVQVQGGNNEFGLIQGTISDTVGIFGYRITGRYQNYGGDFDNTKQNGPDVGGYEQASLNGTFVFDATDSMAFTLNLQAANNKDDQYAILLQRPEYNNCTFDNDPSTGPRDYYCGTLNTDIPVELGGAFDAGRYGSEEDRIRTSLVWDWDVNWATIKWINSYNTRDFDSTTDQSFGGETGGLPGFPFFLPPSLQTTADEFHTVDKSKEKDFSSEFWLRGGETLRWGAGAYAFKQEIKDEGGDADTRTPIPNNFQQQDVTNLAIMGSIEIDLGSRWTTGLELRYAQDKIEQSETEIGSPTASFSDTFNSLLGRLTASFQATDATMLYGNLSTGSLPGGFNTDPDLVAERPDLIVIEEQDLTQLEFGVKSDLSDSVRLTWALYGLLWEKQGRSEVVDLPSGTSVNYEANQGDSQILGTEADLRWYLTENLIWGVGGAWNETEIKDFCSPDPTDRDIAGVSGVNASGIPCADLSGQELPLVPQWDFTTNLTWIQGLGRSGLELVTRLDLSAQDSRYVRPINLTKTGTETLLSGQIGLQKDNWRVSLWGKNLTDEDAAVSGLRYIEAPKFFDLAGEKSRAFAVTPRPGREYGLTVNFDFGGE